MTKEEILKTVKDESVEFIRLQFTDIFGMIKSIDITVSQLERVLEKGRMFDGSSVDGFARVEESDMRLVPDLDTFCILPFTQNPGKLARLVCDVQTTDGQPFAADPRNVLKKALDHAKKLGYTIDIGPECEFFLFNIDNDGQPILTSSDTCGYFDVAPLDDGASCRRAICLALEQMGYVVEASHHENAKAQHEIDFQFCDALEAADKIMTFRLAVKSIAREHNMYATFMPKPLYGMAGSGMHINISLNKDGRNVMYGENVGNLSDDACHFVAGLLSHAKGFCAVTNPLVNSYKRLVSGYEAPTNIAWSAKNRSPLIRVPYFDPRHARVELRNPDPACNPYLALAVIIEAGLDGVEKKLDPPEITTENIFKLTEQQLNDRKVYSLPEDLDEALECLKADTCILNALGTGVCDVFIAAKSREWAQYKTMVTSWELENYLLKY